MKIMSLSWSTSHHCKWSATNVHFSCISDCTFAHCCTTVSTNSVCRSARLFLNWKDLTHIFFHAIFNGTCKVLFYAESGLFIKRGRHTCGKHLGYAWILSLIADRDVLLIPRSAESNVKGSKQIFFCFLLPGKIALASVECKSITVDWLDELNPINKTCFYE